MSHSEAPICSFQVGDELLDLGNMKDKEEEIEEKVSMSSSPTSGMRLKSLKRRLVVPESGVD